MVRLLDPWRPDLEVLPCHFLLSIECQDSFFLPQRPLHLPGLQPSCAFPFLVEPTPSLAKSLGPWCLAEVVCTSGVAAGPQALSGPCQEGKLLSTAPQGHSHGAVTGGLALRSYFLKGQVKGILTSSQPLSTSGPQFPSL